MALADAELSVEIIEGSGSFWAAKGHAARAARLAGASDGLRDLAAMPRTDQDQKHLQRLLTPTRNQIGSQEWALPHGSGLSLGAEDAVGRDWHASRRILSGEEG